jgi:hypothetical protein
MISITTTCPQATRTRNRRISKSKIYASKSWKENKTAFVADKKCQWCGSTEKLLPHHPYKDTPDGIYEDLYLSECVVLCGTCHFMLERRHKIRCPVCRENWMPIDPTIDRCWSCHLKANPGKAEAIAAERERRELAVRQIKKEQAERRRASKKKHPCVRYRVGGKCSASMLDTMCQFSPTKAAVKCVDFVAKKVSA